MNKLAKALAKMPTKDRTKIKNIVEQIAQGNYQNLDLNKLVGRDDIYRVRQGDWRIIFRMVQDEVYILAIERRSDNTYNF